ncbi:hypothetical protein Barb4_00887 [Bacteroidales bacterium Barb4]|nr:hypothetical protein Barb4_00887 [Bacteroidales bacterium Barb4]
MDGRLIAFSTGTIVAFSDDDGLSWRSLPNSPTRNFRSAFVLGSRVIAVGNDEASRPDNIYYSDDKGITWTVAKICPPIGFYISMYYTNGRLFALSYRTSPSSVVFSDDRGETWHLPSTSPPVYKWAAINGF